MLTPASTFSNIEAEKSLLGCMILDKDCLIDTLLQIAEGDFFDTVNKEIFTAIKKLHKKNQAVDLISICNNSSVDISQLALVTNNVSMIDAYRHHIDIIKENSVKRQLSLNAGKINNFLLDVNDMDYNEIYSNCLSLLHIECDTKKKKSFVEMTVEFLDNLENKEESRLKYGIPWLDSNTHGLHKSNLIYVAARPSCGKTALSLNIMTHLIKTSNNVAFFSLEMGVDELLQRVSAAISKVEFDKIRCKKVSPDEYVTVSNNLMAISNVDNLFVYDDVFDLEKIKVESKTLKNKGKLDAIIIDYLQLMRTKERMQNDNSRIEYMSRELKLLAKELKIPVICLSQLSRDGANVEPKLNHLRGSGAIEQDADVVLFLYDENEGKYEDKTQKWKDIQIIIAKQRQGVRNIAKKIRFYGDFQKFCEVDGRHV